MQMNTKKMVAPRKVHVSEWVYDASYVSNLSSKIPFFAIYKIFTFHGYATTKSNVPWF